MSELRPYGPGKFDTMLDAAVYAASLDGGPEDECACEGLAWYGLVRTPLLSDESLAELTESERAFLSDVVGAILMEQDNGFVSVDYYTDTAELDAEWTRIQGETDGIALEWASRAILTR